MLAPNLAPEFRPPTAKAKSGRCVQAGLSSSTNFVRSATAAQKPSLSSGAIDGADKTSSSQNIFCGGEITSPCMTKPDYATTERPAEIDLPEAGRAGKLDFKQADLGVSSPCNHEEGFDGIHSTGRCGTSVEKDLPLYEPRPTGATYPWLVMWRSDGSAERARTVRCKNLRHQDGARHITWVAPGRVPAADYPSRVNERLPRGFSLTMSRLRARGKKNSPSNQTPSHS